MPLKELEKIREAVVNGCMKCGFCTFFCPIYQETLDEGNVARGKIALVREVLAGNLPLTPDLLEKMDTCLLCKSCVTNCPTKVGSDRIIMAARADYVQSKGLPLTEKILFRHVLSNRPLFGRLARLGSTLQKIMPLPSTHGLVRHLPHLLRGMARGGLIPPVSDRFLRDRLPAVIRPPQGVRTQAVAGFFSGCGLEFVYPQDGVDAVTLLARHGVEVHYPKTQSCCGMPVFSQGDLVAAKRLAERNIEAFRDYDIIVTACATCSSALKHLPEYLGLAETEGPTIRSFAARVVDLNEYLIHLFASAATALEVSKEYAGKKVTWHDPCHLSRHQGIVEQPRRILRAVSNVRYVEMPEADRCCGMGGAFGIHHYELSEKIAKRKVECIRESGADLVVTSCPGCLIQLDHALVQNGLPQRAVHIAHFLKGKAPPHRHLGAART